MTDKQEKSTKDPTAQPDDFPDLKPTKSFWGAGAKVEPKNKGCKTLPVGKNLKCLVGKTFVITGCLDSLERDECSDLIKKYGGRATGSVSGKTNYLIAGVDEFGEIMKGSKYKKAETSKTCEIINEDDLFKLIQHDYDPENAVQDDLAYQMPEEPELIPEASPKKPAASAAAAGGAPAATAAAPRGNDTDSFSLWTDKYKPKTMKDLIGNQESIKKLHTWLSQWKVQLKQQNAKLSAAAAAAEAAAAGKKGKAAKAKAPTLPKGKEMKKSALLSGPPGIGKTSAASLVARELGYEVLEFNASSVRSKKAIMEQVMPKVGNHSIGEYYTSSGEASTARELVLIMDECDGMSGADRGGIATLIELIKETKFPIICICNDRQHQKVRSLANHCLDVPFARPTSRHMLAKMMKIAYSEGLKVSPNQIVSAAESSGCDVRQVINVLQMAQSSAAGMADYSEESSKKDRQCMLGPFDVVWPLFSREEVSKTSINQRIDYFFVDFSMVPMIVQENYLAYRPASAKNVVDELDAVSRAADAIAESDLTTPYIRGANQNWGLLPFAGVQSTVAPAYHMRCEAGGGPRSQGWQANSIKFPGILGKMSSTNKRHRILSLLQAHTRHRASTDKAGMRLDYLPRFRHMITDPLVNRGKEGIVEAMEKMELYGIDREDYDTLTEVVFKEDHNPVNDIPTAVKTAFTRAWNQRQKDFVQVSKGKKKGAKAATSLPEEKPATQNEDEDFIDDEEDDHQYM
eukprot:TRINITY_DN13771_c0_g3_i1.p1 TRINITY_DN13771_c0_g3~~TRINITY_DN13771_c0_g3_i1.p1  ORF type:complete len:744 (-),score=224.28 TRINITY_DN13771_c0_g3_i1:81-2312(-)